MTLEAVEQNTQVRMSLKLVSLLPSILPCLSLSQNVPAIADEDPGFSDVVTMKK